ncbi:MAG: 3-hydroxyacyl-CoA dehydrogenase family protein [Chitinophagaceae bacterium]
MKNSCEPKETCAGVVGLGLMGSSIVVSLLISGHEVKAIAPLEDDMKLGSLHIEEQLKQCLNFGLLDKPVASYLSQLTVSDNYMHLEGCSFVLECVTEILTIKREVYEKILSVTSEDTIIASNTSAIPISMLQQYITHPGRFLGVHWGEPAYMSRFLEIICGSKTDLRNAEWVFNLSKCWGKEPTLLRKDIRGFVTNRLMYAIYREALHLVENGEATMEDTDKAFKYDAGSWITLMGIFRRMDFVGLKDAEEIFKNIFPKLSNATGVPECMKEMVKLKARGTKTLKGLYEYSPAEAKKWEAEFALFSKDIFELAASYPCDTVE